MCIRDRFYGDASSFVFSLRPAVSVYRATGHNQNFVWCGAGFTSERFPNGIGFGGQVGHFSVFLDGDFEGGHSRDGAATYGSPNLSGQTTNFNVDAVEAWGVGPTPDEDDDEGLRLNKHTGAAKGGKGKGRRGARGVLHDARHNDARMLMETARRDAGGPEREER